MCPRAKPSESLLELDWTPPLVRKFSPCSSLQSALTTVAFDCSYCVSLRLLTRCRCHQLFHERNRGKENSAHNQAGGIRRFAVQGVNFSFNFGLITAVHYVHLYLSLGHQHRQLQWPNAWWSLASWSYLLLQGTMFPSTLRSCISSGRVFMFVSSGSIFLNVLRLLWRSPWQLSLRGSRPSSPRV